MRASGKCPEVTFFRRSYATVAALASCLASVCSHPRHAAACLNTTKIWNLRRTIEFERRPTHVLISPFQALSRGVVVIGRIQGNPRIWPPEFEESLKCHIIPRDSAHILR